MLPPSEELLVRMRMELAREGDLREWLASLQDARCFGTVDRWCRCAQPPATGWDASGIRSSAISRTRVVAMDLSLLYTVDVRNSDDFQKSQIRYMTIVHRPKLGKSQTTTLLPDGVVW